MNMVPSKPMQVRLDSIEIGNRIRKIDPAHVAVLADSIGISGLLSSITVAPAAASDDGISTGRWILVAGAHRLEACRQIGLLEIPVFVLNLCPQARIIAECDENLCGTSLGYADRALLMSRRKAAFEELHPATRHGAASVGQKKSRQIGDIKRFTLDAAKKTGKAERTVQRDAYRGEAIDGDILASIRNTDLDRGGVLDALAKSPRAQQPAKVEQLRLRKKARRTRPIRGTAAMPAGAPTDGGVQSVERSEAAALLLETFAVADVPRFIRMLMTEGFDSFAAALRVESEFREVALNDAHQVERVLHEAAAAVDGLAESGLESASAENLASECDATGLDAAAVVIDEIIPVKLLGGTLVNTERSGELIRPAAIINAVPSGAGLQPESRLRPASWIGLDDAPQRDDRCRECRGARWWQNVTRGSWCCSACFEPARSRART